MAIFADTKSHSGIQSYDGGIIVGYAAFAVIALIAIYFACGGPTMTEADLANGLVMP